MEPEEGEGEEEFVELDLEKTLTWTGNAVSIQAGGEFRLPLIVPHPSVLAIQFEVEGGYDIEVSAAAARAPSAARARETHRAQCFDSPGVCSRGAVRAA